MCTVITMHWQKYAKEYNKIEDERSDDNGKYKCYYEN